VWRWQVRYAEQGVDGLLRDKTRKPGKAPLSPATIAKVLALTCSEPPGEATHWTGRAVAKAVGIGLSSVQRLWEAHRLQPHRIRTFKKSNDPAFAEKVEDIVGLYMNPPCHAVVVSIDEKSQGMIDMSFMKRLWERCRGPRSGAKTRAPAVWASVRGQRSPLRANSARSLALSHRSAAELQLFWLGETRNPGRQEAP